jgi:hypothetical protein
MKYQSWILTFLQHNWRTYIENVFVIAWLELFFHTCINIHSKALLKLILNVYILDLLSFNWHLFRKIYSLETKSMLTNMILDFVLITPVKEKKYVLLIKFFLQKLRMENYSIQFTRCLFLSLIKYAVKFSVFNIHIYL